jgi:hypothetical protein
VCDQHAFHDSKLGCRSGGGQVDEFHSSVFVRAKSEARWV